MKQKTFNHNDIKFLRLKTNDNVHVKFVRKRESEKVIYCYVDWR